MGREKVPAVPPKLTAYAARSQRIGSCSIPILSSVTGGLRLRLHGTCGPSPERLGSELLSVATVPGSQSLPGLPCRLLLTYFAPSLLFKNDCGNYLQKHQTVKPRLLPIPFGQV